MLESSKQVEPKIPVHIIEQQAKIMRLNREQSMVMGQKQSLLKQAQLCDLNISQIEMDLAFESRILNEMEAAHAKELEKAPKEEDKYGVGAALAEAQENVEAQ